MLWDAGQERVTRESRDRRAEMYEAARDGYVAGNVAAGKVKWSGRGEHLPHYVSPEQQRARGIAQLARDLGGQFVRGEREVIQ
jgi:hypothetical protein